MHAYAEDDQWIVVRLQEQLFAVPSATVREMLAIPEIRTVPRVPAHIRGVINLRGQVIPLVDLRLRLCMESSTSEAETLVTMVQAREQDHRNWVTELQAATQEHRPFKLTTDPHACAFGRWYDAFRTPVIALAAVLKKFDAPHRRLHQTGAEVVRLAQENRWDEAVRLCERAGRIDLPLMIKLFSDLRGAIRDSHRETVVVLDGGGSVYAVSVDAVESVERLKAGTIEPVPAAAASHDGLINAVARRIKNDGIVMLLDADHVLNEQEKLATVSAA